MNFTQVTDALSCTAALAGLSKQDLARLSMSTGKSLPKDAGKFIACSGIPGAHYLLATMSGTLSSSSPGVPFGLGLCLPEACGDADVPAILNSPLALQLIPDLSAFSLSNFHVTDPVAGLIQPGALCWVAVATLALLGAAIAFSTLRMCRARVETSQLSGAPPRAPPLLNQAFALVGRNGTMTKLMECPPPKPTDCLNGLRVLAMAWIILGHTFLMPEGVSGYSNSQDITMSAWNKAAAERSPWLMLIIQAEQSVDTFFFLSGFLLSHLMLKELQSRGASPVLAILLRYFRLTPSLALVMLVYYGILPYLASGPFAVILQDSIFRRCNGSWWSELTYTMNFIPFDSDKVCMGWTWYLGDDMIFFVLGSVLVPLYHRRRILGWFLMLCVTGLSLGVTAWLIAKYHLSAYIFDSHYARYSYYAYSKPYTRAPAYFVGVSTAWVLQTLEARGVTRESCERSGKASLGASLAALMAFGVLCLVVFIPATDFGDQKNRWSDFDSVLLLDFGRVGWAASWGIITILCYYGYLPWINGFLAHPAWTPLVRMTYGAYLLHPLVIKLAAGTSVQYYTFSGMELCYRLIGNCCMAYGLAVVLWCLIERPIMTLTTAGLKNRSSSAKTESSSSSPNLDARNQSASRGSLADQREDA
ncbi:unnamed protein product [Effrenium voratum]|nr:unnamed protein product [Effrenium voratum]